MENRRGKFKSRIKSFFKRLWENLPPMVQYALAKGSVFVGAGVVPILLFEYSPQLDFWWVVLLVFWIGLLIALRVLVLWPREKNALINDLGYEQFYALFPQEKKRDERRQRRKERREQKRLAAERKDYY